MVVEQVMAMGFSRSSVEEALQAVSYFILFYFNLKIFYKIGNNHVEMAAEWLLNNQTSSLNTLEMLEDVI